MKTIKTIVGLVLAAGVAMTHAQSDASKPVPVTADNFARAETDLYFGGVVKKGGFGKFEFNREVTPIETMHWEGRQTAYIVAGDKTAERDIKPDSTMTARVFLSEIFVDAQPRARAVVTFVQTAQIWPLASSPNTGVTESAGPMVSVPSNPLPAT